MEKDDLVKRGSRYSKGMGAYVLGLFGITCLFAWWWGLLLRDVPEHEDPWRQIGIAVAAGALFVIVAAFFGNRFLRGVESRNSVGCPHCGRDLVHYSHLIMAACNCCYCGRHLPEGPTDARANVGRGRWEVDPLTVQPAAPARAEFIRKTVAKDKDRERKLKLLFPSLILALPATGLLQKWTESDWTQILALFIFGGILLFFAARSDRKARKTGLSCSNCRTILTNLAPYVIATGNCPVCGKRVLPEEPR